MQPNQSEMCRPPLWFARLLEDGFEWGTFAEGLPLTDPTWTLSRGMGDLLANDVGMLTYAERLAMQIQARTWTHQSVAVRLEEHHHAAGEPGAACPVCRAAVRTGGSSPTTTDPSVGSDQSDVEFDWEEYAKGIPRMSSRSAGWTLRQAMVELRERDQDMMSCLERMATAITLLQQSNATQSAQLESHHKVLDCTREDCPICNNRSSFEELVNDLSGVGRYVLLPLAVAGYRATHTAWPTTAIGSDLRNALGHWDVPLHATLTERLDLTGDSQSWRSVTVRGPDGEATADPQSVGFRTPAYDQAAEWLYGHQWSPGIERSWLDAAESIWLDPDD